MAQMAEQPPTQVGAAETEIVSPVIDYPELAWSEDWPTETHRLDWRRTLANIARYGLPAAAVAASVTFVMTVGGHHQVTTTMPAPPSAVTQTEPPPPHPTITSSPEQDAEYFRLLEAGGLDNKDRAAAIAGGHWVCQWLALGHTGQEIVDMWDARDVAADPSVDKQADDILNRVYVNAAKTAYCPPKR